MKKHSIKNGAARALMVFGLVGALGACDALDNLLSVTNPATIREDQLDDPTLANILVNTVVGDFQAMYADLAYAGAIFTDEAVTGHNFETWMEVDLRQLREDNGTMAGNTYVPLQRTRFSADSISGRLRTLIPEASQDLRLARTLAYAGYTYVLMGEYLCEAPINLSAAFSSSELTGMAVPRFEEAVRVAAAARAAGARAASADSLMHLANVGAARAHLQLGNLARAAEHAALVPANFEFWVAHSDNSGRERNPFHFHTSGSNRNLGVDPSFQGLNDPRLPHTAASTLGHNRLTRLFTPFQPLNFEQWDPTTPAVFHRDTNIRFSSGLEARHIRAEAEGPTAATLEFVNQRRAVANQAPVALEGDALMAELRDQKRRDFYLSGQRLGDLRRYLATGVGNFFPQGQHPNVEWGTYGDDTCFIIPLAERTGNPNL